MFQRSGRRDVLCKRSIISIILPQLPFLTSRRVSSVSLISIKRSVCWEGPFLCSNTHVTFVCWLLISFLGPQGDRKNPSRVFPISLWAQKRKLIRHVCVGYTFSSTSLFKTWFISVFNCQPVLILITNLTTEILYWYLNAKLENDSRRKYPSPIDTSATSHCTEYGSKNRLCESSRVKSRLSGQLVFSQG